MFERCLYFNVNALARAVNRIWDQAFAKFDLSPSHAYLLRLVLASPGLTPMQIAQELKLEKSTVSRFLDALEKRKLVVRKKGVFEDARERAVFPTARSKKIAAELERTGDELYRKMADSIGKKALTTFVSELRSTKREIE